MRDRLAAEIGEVLFDDLRAHIARDAIIIVADALDLIDAGVAVAGNDVAQVSAWIERGELTKPSLADLARWEAMRALRWDALIVAPYVLIKERRSLAS